MEKLPPLLLVMVATLAIIGFFVLAIRWARKSSRRAAFLGWGLRTIALGGRTSIVFSQIGEWNLCHPGRSALRGGIGGCAGMPVARKASR